MTSSRRALLAGVVAFAIFLGMGVMWTFASPPGSVPDETAHIAKATATARGEWTGEPATGEGDVAGQRVMQVPGYVHELALEFSCHYFRADVTADCPGASFDRGNQDVEGFSTTAGLYNPVYYVIVGWPSLSLEGAEAVYGMRLMSALLGGLLMGVAAGALVLAGAGRYGVLALVAGTTPMVAYLSGAVNPNGFEVTAAVAFLASAVAALRRPGWLPLLATAASGALLLNGRSITPLWAAVVAVVVLVLATGPQLRAILRHPATWVAIGVLAVASAFSLWWTLSTDVLTNGVAYAGAGTPPLAGLLEMLARTFEYYPGAVAVLGWLDVPAPVASVVLCGAALVATVVAALVLGTARGRVAVLLVALATALLPALVTALSVETLGYIWQGRYILALLVPTAVVAGIALDDALRHRGGAAVPPTSLVGLVGVLVAVAHLLPVIALTKRYTVGLSATIGDYVLRPSWQPPGGVPLLVAAAALLLLGTTVALVVHMRLEGRLAVERMDAPREEAADGADVAATEDSTSGAREERTDAARVTVDDR